MEKGKREFKDKEVVNICWLPNHCSENSYPFSYKEKVGLDLLMVRQKKADTVPPNRMAPNMSCYQMTSSKCDAYIIQFGRLHQPKGSRLSSSTDCKKKKSLMDRPI